ncbi:MAG: type II secretion system protein [Planctomycetota bacterium]
MFDKRLQLISRSAYRRAAFSLAELVVAIGILLLMLSLAGQVFSFTVRSTGQATAFTEVNQALRLFEDTLRDDLRHAIPGQTMLLIQGNPVNAYWTLAGKEADPGGNPADGYPHPADSGREDDQGRLLPPRADMLMFFAARKDKSYQNSQLPSRVQQVLYGHAELGQYTQDLAVAGNKVAYKFEPGLEAVPLEANTKYPSITAISPVPASQWHLARGATRMVPQLAPTPATNTPLDSTKLLQLRQGAVDTVGQFPFEEVILRPSPFSPSPWFLPAWLLSDPGDPDWQPPYARSQLDVTPPPLLGDRIGHYMLPNCASFKVEWTLDPRSEFVAGRLNGIGEMLWFDPGDLGDPTKANDDDPLRSLQARIDALKKGAKNCPSKEPERALCQNLESLLAADYADGSYYYDAGSQEYFPMKYSLSDRFRGPNFPDPNPDPESLPWPQLSADGKRPNLAVFTAGRPTLGPNVTGTPDPDADYFNTVPDPMFPSALRITVDVLDAAQRLERPIRHVMVIPIGQ